MTKTRTIEVDVKVADALEQRAAAEGMSVAELLADLVEGQELPADLEAMRAAGQGPWSEEALAEDARTLEEFERTGIGVPWEEVRAWMESWGTPNEIPRPKPRKLL